MVKIKVKNTPQFTPDAFSLAGDDYGSLAITSVLNRTIQAIQNYIDAANRNVDNSDLEIEEDFIKEAIKKSDRVQNWRNEINNTPEANKENLREIAKRVVDFVHEKWTEAARLEAEAEDTGEGSSAAAKNAWREAMKVAVPRGFAKELPNNDTMDAWFKLTKAGGGAVDNDKLTAANARDLFSENWFPHSVLVFEGDIQVFNPLTGERVTGAERIFALGYYDNLFNAYHDNFVANFRRAGEPAADKAIISDERVGFYHELHSPNYNFYLPALWAGQAYNHGWTNPDELQITDTGVLQVLIGGNWLDINPTTTSKAKATWKVTMSGPGVAPRNTNLNYNDPITDAWFAKIQPGGGEIRNDQLTAENARQLWNNNWNADDINADGRGQPRVINPENGAFVDGYAAINALGDKNALVDFVTAFKRVTGNVAGLTDKNIRAYLKHSDNGRHHLTGTQAGTIYNNLWSRPEEIRIDNDGNIQASLNRTDWNINPLTTRKGVARNIFFKEQFKAQGNPAALVPDSFNILGYSKNSRPNRTYEITGDQAGQAYNHGWTNPDELQITDTGVLQVLIGGNWLDINPTTTSKAKATWKVTMSGPGVAPRNTNLNYNDPITDAWFAKIQPGGGEIRNDQLTAENARQLWNNNWNADDINADGRGQPRVINPENGAFVDGYAAINALGDKNALVDFVTAFKRVTGNVAGLTDKNIRAYLKHSDNGRHHLTGTQAGTAYNNGWIWNTDIRVNDDGNIQGQVIGTWVNADPTVISHDKARWRFEMGRNPAALPRNQELDNTGGTPAHNAIMDAWFAKMEADGGSVDEDNFTAQAARTLWDRNWEAADILEHEKDIQVINPASGEAVNGFIKIRDLTNDKNNLTRAGTPEEQAIANALNRLETNEGQITEKLNALIDLRDNHGATGTEAEKNAWNHGTNADRVNRVIAALRPKQNIIDALNSPETTDPQKNAKLAQLHTIQTTYPGGDGNHQNAWTFGNNQVDVENAIARLTGATPEVRALTDALGLVETDDGEVTAKLTALTNLRTTYTDPGATVAQTAAWNAGTNQADIESAINRLTEVQNIRRALNLPATNNDEVTAKLTALTPIQNNYPTGSDAQQAALGWSTNRVEVQNALQDLTLKQAIIDALNLPEGTEIERNAKLAQLHTIQTTYPGGDGNHQNAWTFGNNQVDVENAIARLTGATPEVRALTDALGLVETDDGEVTAKLTALTNLRTTYTDPGATVAQTAAWNAGTNQADIESAINRLTEVQNIRRALNLPATNNDEVTAKLTALTPIQNNYPTGSDAQQAALGWSTNRVEVQNALQDLTLKQAIIDALNLPEGTEIERNAKLAQLHTIQTTYPGGDGNHQNAWTFGNNQVDVENAINNLLTPFVAAFRAVGGNAGDDTQINDIEVTNYWISSPDGNHVLTGTQAGNIFNNGWTNSNEIRITNEGNIQATFGTSWNIDPLTTTRAVAVSKHRFIVYFKTASGVSVSDANILEYFDKNLTGVQAAALYNGSPRVLGSELTKGTNNDEVKFDGKDYKVNNPDSIIAAKQAKIDADNATKLAQAKTTALNTIQALLDDTSDSKPKITDTEVKTQLNKTDNNLIDGTTLKDWKDYLNAASTTAEVSSRETKIKQAITAIRKARENPPFDAAATRTKAISEVKNYWKSKSSDQTETGTVNGKKIEEVLGAEWEKEFDDKNDQAAIESKKSELTAKIESEKVQEKKTPAPVSSTEVEEILQEVVVNNEVKPSSTVTSSWQAFNNPDSELKTAQQIKQFLTENIKDKTVDFVQSLKELPAAEQPTGKDEQEKMTNFLTQQKAETVIKAVFSYKLKKEENFRKEVEVEMENKKDTDEKVLDPQFYPKKDGKFTPEAMVNYLLQKKTGQAFRFATVQEQKGGPKEKSHWEKYGFWYIGGTVLVVAAAGLAIVVWDTLKSADKKED
ncbi:MAG: hypothetical protein I3275_01870 [Candidatus Moeniiplasma glomeromycotorum]|nr:hypothetical protein [Candidatus Moeniiplasma glomeromycotorum]